MSDLTELATFVCIVRHGSFRAASAELGISPPASSQALKRLESRLGLKLINRSTRSLSLTEAGRRLYEDLSTAFTNIECAVDNLSELRDTPTGNIRIAVVRTAAKLHIARLVNLFVSQYPGMTVEIYADDTLTTLSDDNFDAGVRLGNIVPDHMVAIPISPQVRFAVVATPDYWKKHSAPSHPQSLQEHNCIVFRFPTSKRPYQWEFRCGNDEYIFDATGNIIVNDMDIEMDLVLKGAGVGYLILEQALPYIRSGELTSVLEEWLPERPGFYLYYPASRLKTRGFEAFKNFVKYNNQKD